MAKIYNFEVENNISEVAEQLNEIITRSGKKKIKLEAPPKSGKTHYFLNGLYVELGDREIGTILYGPTKVWGRDVCNRRIELTRQRPILCNGDIKGEILTDDFLTPIASTPDSAGRGIKAFKGKNYFQIVDEYHEVVSNSTFRRGLKYPDKYYNDPKCLGMVCATGTPENLMGIDFDIEIYIKVKNRMKFPKLNLYYVNHFSVGMMASAINFVMNQHTKDTKFFVRLNDIEKAEKVLKLINIEDKTLIHSKQTGESAEYIEELINNNNVEMKKLTITTSTLDSGTEIWTNDKMVIIQFRDGNTDFTNISQSKCRLRNGSIEVNEFINIKPSQEPIEQLEKIKQGVKRYAENELEFASTFYKNGLYKSKFLEYEYNGKYTYKIDDDKVSKEISDIYFRELYAHPEEIKKYYENNFVAAEFEEVEIRNFNENGYGKVDKEIKEEKKAKAEEIALKEESFIDWGIEHHEEVEIARKLLKEEENFNEELSKQSEFILSSDGRELSKKMDYVIKELNCTEHQALIKIKNGEYEEMIFKDQFIAAIRRYHIDPIIPTRISTKYFNIPYYNEVYYIYISIQELNKGKIIRFRLGDTNIKKLLSKLEEWHKKRYLCKIEEDTLHKYLEIMFVLDKENRITSIKKYTDNN